MNFMTNSVNLEQGKRRDGFWDSGLGIRPSLAVVGNPGEGVGI